MGRKRLKKLAEFKKRLMPCSECKRGVEVFDTQTVAVKCPLCSSGVAMVPIPDGYTADLDAVEKEIEQERRDNMERMKKERELAKNNPLGIATQTVTISKKGGKRGKKSTVGKAVLDFVASCDNQEATYEDILKVYSEVRERLGKKADPETEARNGYATVYNLVKKGSLKEIERRKKYSLA